MAIQPCWCWLFEVICILFLGRKCIQEDKVDCLDRVEAEHKGNAGTALRDMDIPEEKTIKLETNSVIVAHKTFFFRAHTT